MRTEDLRAKTAELSETGLSFVLATITEANGSSPRGAGRKMIVFRDVTTLENVGRGALEKQFIADVLSSVASGHS